MGDVANRYANALFLAAGEINSAAVDRYGALLASFDDSLSKDAKAREFFLSPRVEKSRKKDFLADVFGVGDDRAMLNFLGLLIAKNRFSALSDIRTAYERLAREKRNAARAVIETAFPLTDEEIDRIAASFRRKLGVDSVEACVVVKPDLIGGIRVCVGSAVYDGTARSDLDRLYEKMTR